MMASTNDTATLLPIGSRRNRATTGDGTATEVVSTPPVANPTVLRPGITRQPSNDRSKKNLTVKFSTGIDGSDGNGRTGDDSGFVSLSPTVPDRNDRTQQGQQNAADTNAGSTPISYDNYAGPSNSSGSRSTGGMPKFLTDDSIWKDLRVNLSGGLDDGVDPIVSDDLLDVSASSSIVQGGKKQRSWTSPLSVRNRVENIRSKCLPNWASIKSFVFAICILITVHGALATGYTMSVITTIEKRFEISSKTSGLVVSSYEFGSLLSVVFVSYFGSNAHIPRVIGMGGLVLALGSFLFSLPHLIAPIYLPSNSSGIGASDACQSSSNTSTMGHMTPSNCQDENGPYVLVLMLAQILLGIGGTPLFTLGTTYIDNHVEKESASIYLAYMYVSMALGPVLGFLLGALMLSEYVNAKVPEFLTTNSPEWVGLWWGGFIVCGGLYAVSSLPFFLFPRRLSNKRATDEDNEYGRSWKKIPVSIVQLLTNRVYMVATFNACVELAIVTGFTVFLPKYLETQFRVSTANASVLTGAVAVPGACVGIFFGGWIMKRMKLELQGVANLVILVNTAAMLMMTGFFLFGCGTMEIAGVTTPYRTTAGRSIGQINLTHPCNDNCHCSREELQSKAVCGVDGLTYMSPCFAGCTVGTQVVRKQNSIVGDFSQTRYEYSQCSCIVQPAAIGSKSPDEPHKPQAKEGMCDASCGMLVPFMILVFGLSLAASNNQMPVVMVTLRSVSTQEKAFGLGVQVVILRLLSYIPSPIIYGDVIDSTCVFWNEKCGVSDKNCLVYDIYGFRMRFAALSLALTVMGVALSLLLWFSIKRRYTPFSPPVTMSEIAHRFGDFDNLHIVRSRKMRSWVSDDSLVNKRPYTPRHQKTRSC